MNTEKAKTLDGKRTAVGDMNTAIPQALEVQSWGLWAKIAKSYKNISLFMAGMYTGVGCSGTPHTHHSYDESDKSGKPIDRRPI